MTSWQQQIVTGTLLGSSSLIKPKKGTNYYLTIVDKNHKWVLYKAESLNYPSNIIKTGNRLRWRTRSLPEWHTFRENHYKDNKKIIKSEVLDTLRDIGLAIWFGDKGFWETKHRVGLRTACYGEQNKLIEKYFNEVGISCYVSHGRIIFTRKGTLVFLKTIANCLPSFMYSKLEY